MIDAQAGSAREPDDQQPPQFIPPPSPPANGHSVGYPSHYPLAPQPSPHMMPVPEPPLTSAGGYSPVQIQTAAPRRNVAWLVAALVAVAAGVAGLAVGGEPSKFMQIGLQFVPLAILAALAYGGIKNSASAVFAYVWLVIVAIAVLLNAFLNLFIAYIKSFSLLVAWEHDPRGSSLSDVFRPGVGSGILLGLLLLFFVSLVSASMLLRPVRVALSRVLPIDPDNFVHKIALSIVTLIMLSSFVPLLVLGGQPPLLEFVTSGGMQQIGGSDAFSVRPQDLVYQLVWTIPATFVAGGWPVARKWRTMLARLGLVRPTLKQVGFAVGMGGALFLLSSFVVEPGINWVWQQLGWGTTDVAAFSKLMSQVVTLPGAVLIGVTAGFGEELAIRGLLQPRIGLLASNLLFTSLHAFQYGPDALLSVFTVGMILGVVRARTNTSTSAIIHGLYDFISVMASVLGH